MGKIFYIFLRRISKSISSSYPYLLGVCRGYPVIILNLKTKTMPTAAQLKAAGTKVPAKVKLINHSGDNTGGNIEVVSRIPLADAMEVGCKFGKVFITKKTDEREGSGGKPGVWMTLPEKIAEKFELEGDSITLWFHSSGKAVLADTGNRLSKRMDLVEIKLIDTEEHSYIITATDTDLTSETTELAD